MKIPAHVMAFRKDVANDIRSLQDMLNATHSGLWISGSFQPIIAALKEERAKDHPEEAATKSSYWGYKLENYRISFNKNPRHIHPETIQDLTLLFEVHVVADHEDLSSVKDPFKYLAFNVVIEGRSGEKSYINAFHLDRHLGGVTDEAHPIYHIHFGGDKLNKKTRDFGEAIFLDAPRLMHYPMELILGIDFVLANFFPEAWDTLKKQGPYITLLKKYQNFFWKPFAYALASHWNDYDSTRKEWQSQKVLPNLV
ncbi:MAG: hypothetical protein AB7U26_03100 [Sulfuricurvum sp.]